MVGAFLRRRDRTVRSLRLVHYSSAVNNHRSDLAANGGVFLHVGLDDGRLGAEAERLEHGHRGSHAVGAGHVAAGRHHAPVAAAHDHGDVAQLGPVALLDRGVEGVAVEMGDGEVVELRMVESARRPASRAGPGIRGRLAAAIAAEGVHDPIIEPAGCRAKAFARPGRAADGRGD